MIALATYGIAVFTVLLLIGGGFECDRADCGAVYDFTQKHQPFTSVLVLGISVAVGGIAARISYRRFRTMYGRSD